MVQFVIYLFIVKKTGVTMVPLKLEALQSQFIVFKQGRRPPVAGGVEANFHNPKQSQRYLAPGM